MKQYNFNGTVLVELRDCYFLHKIKIMKTILPALLLIFSGIKVSAQFTEPGQVVLGGNFSVYSQKDSSYNSAYLIKNASYSATVSAGKFVKKNVLSKFSIGIAGSNSKNIYSNFTGSTPSVSFNIGYSRTYYKQLVKSLYFGIGGGSISIMAPARSNKATTIPKSRRIRMAPTLVCSLNLLTS